MNNEALQFENTMVLVLVQALTGAVTPNLLAVSVYTDVAENRLDIFFAVEHTDATFEELVEEIVVDVDALTAGELRLKAHVWEGTTWVNEDWPGLHKRFVFARAVESTWTEPDES